MYSTPEDENYLYPAKTTGVLKPHQWCQLYYFMVFILDELPNMNTTARLWYLGSRVPDRRVQYPVLLFYRFGLYPKLKASLWWTLIKRSSMYFVLFHKIRYNNKFLIVLFLCCYYLYGVSWPSGLAYRTQVLVLAAECGFQSWPWHLCPWAIHLIIIASLYPGVKWVPVRAELVK